MQDRPGSLNGTQFEAFRRAAIPGDADVLLAKAILQGALAGKAVSTAELIHAVMLKQGVDPYATNEHYLMSREQSEIDRLAAPISRARISFACRLALAEMQADGLIVPCESPSNDFLSVQIELAGHRGASGVAVSTPQLASHYMTTPGRIGTTSPMVLDKAKFLEGMEGLLDSRAILCLDEALAAWRRGLYLSAVNLFGALSEAAWYRVGEALRARNPELGSAIDGHKIAEVIRLAGDILSTGRGQATVVTELRAHAAYLRDLRNFGVHPNEDPDPGQADAFTEAGSLLLLMSTHRYLARLHGSAAAAGVDFAAMGSP